MAAPLPTTPTSRQRLSIGKNSTHRVDKFDPGQGRYMYTFPTAEYTQEDTTTFRRGTKLPRQ